MEEPENFPFHTSKAYRKVQDELGTVESSINTYEEFLGNITSEFRSQIQGRGHVKVEPLKLLEKEQPEDPFIHSSLHVDRELGSKDVRVIRKRCLKRIDELRKDRKKLISDLEYFETAYNHFIEILAAYRHPGINPISRDLSGKTADYIEVESDPVSDDFEWFNENMESREYIESVL